MDVFSRYIISWWLANTLEPEFCCEALKEALESGCSEYFNTDQGAQFTSSEFFSILQGEEIKISLDGKGRMIDNIFIELLADLKA
jgi:putative transposase